MQQLAAACTQKALPQEAANARCTPGLRGRAVDAVLLLAARVAVVRARVARALVAMVMLVVVVVVAVAVAMIMRVVVVVFVIMLMFVVMLVLVFVGVIRGGLLLRGRDVAAVLPLCVHLRHARLCLRPKQLLHVHLRSPANYSWCRAKSACAQDGTCAIKTWPSDFLIASTLMLSGAGLRLPWHCNAMTRRMSNTAHRLDLHGCTRARARASPCVAAATSHSGLMLRTIASSSGTLASPSRSTLLSTTQSATSTCSCSSRVWGPTKELHSHSDYKGGR